MEVTTQNPKLMRALTDRELIEALQNKKDEKEFEAVFTQFYNRFVGYVFKIASQSSRNFSNAEDLSKDITQETFKSIWQSKKPFTLPSDASDAECSNKIKGWLGRIANNRFNKEFARLKTIDSLDDALSHLPEPTCDPFMLEEDNITPDPPNETMVKLLEALGSIKKERDKHILREYARESCIDSNQHLSTSSMNYLCEFYKTTPDNIRQIKKRTLDKIKHLLF